MRKEIFTLLFLLCIALASQGKQQNVKEWTIMVYMAADNNLDPFAIINLDQMISANLADNVNIVVQVDRQENAQWTTCRRIVIKKKLDYNNNYDLDLGEINTGDPKCLTEFIDWSIENYPARKYGLVIWNHGDGWRNVTISDSYIRPSQVYKAVAADDTDHDKLYLHEISTALKNCKQKLTNNKLEFIGFDACLMSMLEVWYELKDFANYGIGSEDLEPGNGWPYDKIINSICEDPSAEGRTICPKIVKDYARFYKDNPELNESYTLSAIDLSKIKTIAQDLNLISDKLAVDMDRVVSARNYSRAYAFDPQYSSPNGIDLISYCENLASATSNLELKKELNKLIADLNSAVIENQTDSVNALDFGSKGMTIYFPISKAVYLADNDGVAYSKSNTVFPVSFVQNERWSEFLQIYFKKKVN